MKKSYIFFHEYFLNKNIEINYTFIDLIKIGFNLIELRLGMDI